MAVGIMEGHWGKSNTCEILRSGSFHVDNSAIFCLDCESFFAIL